MEHLRFNLLSTIVISHLLTVLYSTVFIDDEESTIRAVLRLLRYSTKLAGVVKFYYTCILHSTDIKPDMVKFYYT